MNSSQQPIQTVKSNFSFYEKYLGDDAYRLISDPQQIIDFLVRGRDKSKDKMLVTRLVEITTFDQIKDYIINDPDFYYDLSRSCRIIILNKYLSSCTNLDALINVDNKISFKYLVTSLKDRQLTQNYQEKLEFLEIVSLLSNPSLSQVKEIINQSIISDKYFLSAKKYWNYLSKHHLDTCTSKKEALVIYPYLDPQSKALAIQVWGKKKIIDINDKKNLRSQNAYVEDEVIVSDSVFKKASQENEKNLLEITTLKKIKQRYRFSVKKSYESELIRKRWIEIFTQHVQTVSNIKDIFACSKQLPRGTDNSHYFKKLAIIVNFEIEKAATLKHLIEISSYFKTNKNYKIKLSDYPLFSKKYLNLIQNNTASHSLVDITFIFQLIQDYLEWEMKEEICHLIINKVNQTEIVNDLLKILKSRPLPDDVNQAVKYRIYYLTNHQSK